MKTIHLLLILCILLFFVSACKKSEKEPYSSPKVYTRQPLDVTNTKALFKGKFTKGSDNIIEFGFEWKKTAESTYKKVSAQASLDNFSATVSDLEEDKEYVVRAFITDASNATFYANEINFFTKGTVVDIDENIYLTLRYGNKVWMTENMRVTRFADGTPIEGRSGGKNEKSDGPVYYYNNWHTPNFALGKPNFGLLYNWAAAAKAEDCETRAVLTAQGICPDGWHLPSFEWRDLIDMYGGNEVAANMMKTSNWPDSLYAVTNQSLFSIEPAGCYYWETYNNVVSDFIGLYESAFFWTLNQYSVNEDHSMASGYQIKRGFSKIAFIVMQKSAGYSVRCVKD